MNKLEVFKGARKLIENIDNWTTRVLCRKADNTNCLITDAGVCKFCMVGAMLKAGDIGYPATATPEKYMYYDSLYNELCKHLPSDYTGNRTYLGGFNDASKHEDVLAVFDKVIAQLEQEQANV